MVFKHRSVRAIACMCAIALFCLASRAGAQCIGYAAAPGPGVFIPGVDDVGNHCDDCVTPIAFPFNVEFYGTLFSGASVSSNGNLQFATTNAGFGNVCLPVATMGAAIFPFWDDQRTDTVGTNGIFTTTTGNAPNRKFIVEWRTIYYNTPSTDTTQDYEIVFTEGQRFFDVIYSPTFADRASATIGCQDGAGTFTEFVCNAAGPAAGTSLRFACVTASTAGACCNVAAGTCNISTAAACVAPNTFSGIGSTCPSNCPQPGACCNTTTGACTQTGAAGCPAPSAFSGVGTVCNPNPCTGACCNATTGGCTTTGASGCVAPNTFQGLGMVCFPNPCPQEACCSAATGACSIAGPGACPSGTTGQGAGTSCTPNNCPQQACCNPVTGACSVSGPSTCPSGTTGQGVGTSCAVNPCPQPPPPSNDNCADVVIASGPTIPGIGGVVTGNNSAATTDGAATCGGSGTKDVYFLFTPASTGDWKFDTCATAQAFDTVISIHSGCPADATNQLVCNDDFCGLLSTVTAPGLSAGVQVIVRVASFANGTVGGVFTLTVAAIQNGACCNAGTGGCTSSATGALGCAAGTVYQGNGTSCTVNPCPQPPTGACCLANTQTCSEIPSASCTQQGGTYQGNNSTCTTSACPFGACCLGCVGCFVQSPAGCTSSGGTYRGDGSVCETANCPTTGTNIVSNGDFEAGNAFTGWTQFGDMGFTAVTTGPWVGINAHGGTNHAHLGPTGAIGGIEQAITANVGDHVTIGFWYACTGNNNSFAAKFDGQTLVSFLNDTAHTTYTLFVFQVTVTTANPTLRFECFNPPLYVYLDDIVTCVSAGASGVCCRGSTCNTTITTAAACTASLVPGQTAGAFFSSAAACNAAVVSRTPCCYADYDKINGITVTDIFNFLTDWFAGSPYARVGSSGGPGVLAPQNIFDFLNNWFAGGC